MSDILKLLLANVTVCFACGKSLLFRLSRIIVWHPLPGFELGTPTMIRPLDYGTRIDKNIIRGPNINTIGTTVRFELQTMPGYYITILPGF